MAGGSVLRDRSGEFVLFCVGWPRKRGDSDRFVGCRIHLL